MTNSGDLMAMERAKRSDTATEEATRKTIGGAGADTHGVSCSDPGGVGARARFEALVVSHLDGLYRTALRLTKERTRAEYLVQSVMFKTWRSFHTFQKGASGRAWLYRTLMNAYFGAYRNRTRGPETVDIEDVGGFCLYDKAAARADLAPDRNPAALLDQIMDEEVRDSLETLPEQFRAAVLLADLEGFSYKETAEILGVPVGTVMSRLSLGRHLLERNLWDYACENDLFD